MRHSRFFFFLAGKQELYAPDRVQCDLADRVDCEDRPICDENDENCIEPASTVSTVTPPTGKPDFDCPSPSGYFADPKNCIKYYHCFEGNVEEHITCPNGNHIFLRIPNLDKVNYIRYLIKKVYLYSI